MVDQVYPEHSPNQSITAEHSNVNKTVVEISDRTLSVIAIVLGSMGLVASGVAFYEAAHSEREARMLQYYVLELDGKFMAAGLKKPDEAVSAKLKEKRK